MTPAEHLVRPLLVHVEILDLLGLELVPLRRPCMLVRHGATPPGCEACHVQHTIDSPPDASAVSYRAAHDR